MKTVKIILTTIFFLTIVAGGGLFFAGYFSPKPGGIRIETTPKASVFINGAFVGETPYTGSFKAGTIILRLVPEGSSETLVPFETSIILSPGIETAVGRSFTSSEDTSSGYIISFEKISGKTAALVVTSQPANAQVQVDGVSRGFSPYSAGAIAPATHTITVKAPGYTDLSMTVKTMEGFRMSFYAKLGKGENKNSVSGGENNKTPIKIVKILDTPTGFLRVRSQPGDGGGEIAQVKPGETFPYIDTDIATGWIEIQYEASKSGLPSGITGWISGNYATISSTLK